MTTVWIAIALLTIGTDAIKSDGPIAVGGRDLPPQASAVVARLAPSLLAALVVVDTFGGTDRTLSVDATAVGVLAAAAALVARLPMAAVVVVAAVATAAARALSAPPADVNGGTAEVRNCISRWAGPVVVQKRTLTAAGRPPPPLPAAVHVPQTRGRSRNRLRPSGISQIAATRGSHTRSRSRGSTRTECRWSPPAHSTLSW